MHSCFSSNSGLKPIKSLMPLFKMINISINCPSEVGIICILPICCGRSSFVCQTAIENPETSYGGLANLMSFRQMTKGNVNKFLVACYATLHPALSVRPSVRPSVRRSVGPSHFTFFVFLRFLASLLLPK